MYRMLDKKHQVYYSCSTYVERLPISMLSFYKAILYMPSKAFMFCS